MHHCTCVALPDTAQARLHEPQNGTADPMDRQDDPASRPSSVMSDGTNNPFNEDFMKKMNADYAIMDISTAPVQLKLHHDYLAFAKGHDLRDFAGDVRLPLALCPLSPVARLVTPPSPLGPLPPG